MCKAKDDNAVVIQLQTFPKYLILTGIHVTNFVKNFPKVFLNIARAKIRTSPSGIFIYVQNIDFQLGLNKLILCLTSLMSLS